MPALVSIIFTAVAAAAPGIAPFLANAPAWAHALMTASVAALGAVYHLYQPTPSGK
jgi:hypothetical protein